MAALLRSPLRPHTFHPPSASLQPPALLRLLQPLSVERAFRAVRRSEVAVLVLDASEGVTQQDFRLAEYIVSCSLKCL